MWQLFVVDGADAKTSFPLASQGVTTIGNGQNYADICLHDLYVARVHCRIEITEEAILVRDCEASKGTYINGEPITEKEFKSGDILRVGNSHLRLEFATPPDPHGENGSSENGSAKEVTPRPDPRKLPTLPADRLAELTGYILSHYEIGQVLGQGYKEVVFKARDLKDNQIVALKVLSPEFGLDVAQLQRYVDAIKTVLPLRQENLVTLLNAGKTGPYCWMALEHIEGETLAQWINQLTTSSTIKWRSALRMGLQLGKTLEFVHGHHLVHGNITPHHILIRAIDRVVKLGDLMLSQTLEKSAFQNAILETVHPTDLAYRSPEQVTPQAFVDGLSDIYSLGAVLYARMTGRPPFVANSTEELLQQITTMVPVKPRKYQRNIPLEMETLVLRMLAKHQEDRYQSIREVLADLEKIAEMKEIEV